MSKITKKELQYQINGLAAEASTRHNSIMRIHRALSSIGVDISSDDFDLTEPKPQLKQLDQSVFDGLDEKWRFAAVDEDGMAYIYQSKPRAVSTYFIGGNGCDYKNIGIGYDASNWQNSLIERDVAEELLEVDLSSELTGSDLARAMLGRSNEYVMCLVGDECEESAKNSEIVRVICSRGADYFDDTTEDMWYFAVPINNQGEPLTAAEAGL